MDIPQRNVQNAYDMYTPDEIHELLVYITGWALIRINVVLGLKCTEFHHSPSNQS